MEARNFLRKQEDDGVELISQPGLLIVVLYPGVDPVAGRLAPGGRDLHLALHPRLVESPGDLGVEVPPGGGPLSLLDMDHDVALHRHLGRGPPPVPGDLDEVLVDLEDQLGLLESGPGLYLELAQLDHVGDDGDRLVDSI